MDACGDGQDDHQQDQESNPQQPKENGHRFFPEGGIAAWFLELSDVSDMAHLDQDLNQTAVLL